MRVCGLLELLRNSESVVSGVSADCAVNLPPEGRRMGSQGNFLPLRAG